jgi:hypothetical protein
LPATPPPYLDPTRLHVPNWWSYFELLREFVLDYKFFPRYHEFVYSLLLLLDLDVLPSSPPSPKHLLTVNLALHDEDILAL